MASSSHSLQVILFDPQAQPPKRMYPTDAGFDLYCNQTVIIEPQQLKLVKTGVGVVLPSETFGRICGRSGLTSKKIIVHSGTIDVGYLGELLVMVHNLSSDPVEIKAGTRIAQLIVIPLLPIYGIKIVHDCEHTPRAASGFGSTDLI